MQICLRPNRYIIYKLILKLKKRKEKQVSVDTRLVQQILETIKLNGFYCMIDYSQRKSIILDVSIIIQLSKLHKLKTFKLQ